MSTQQCLLIVLALGSCKQQADVTTRHNKPAAAIEQCVTATQATLRDKPDSSKARNVAKACASLYVEARCRNAQVKAGELKVHEFARHIMQECSQAYCPILPQPKPQACAENSQQSLDSWAELRVAIHRFDLGQAYAHSLQSRLAKLKRFGPSGGAHN